MRGGIILRTLTLCAGRTRRNITVNGYLDACRNIHLRNDARPEIPYCDYLILVLFNANFAKTRKIALLNTRNNNVFTTHNASQHQSLRHYCKSHLFIPAKCEGQQNRNIKCAY